MYRAQLRFLTPLLAVVLPVALAAQQRTAVQWADSIRSAIDHSFIRGNEQGVKEALALADRALVLFPDDAMLLHYRGYAGYRLWTLSANRGDTHAVEAAIAAFERSSAMKSIPETSALLARSLGALIAADPARGIELGMRSGQLMGTALSDGPANPRVWLLSGISAMFTPPGYGGGIRPAEERMRRAIELFGKDRPAAPMPVWGHAEAYAWLGQMLQQQGKTAEARTAYNKALELEKDFSWVKNVLLPALSQ
jgi:tetratricopeptide (TPR) repeat protein